MLVLVPVVVCWAGIDVGEIGVVTLARRLLKSGGAGMLVNETPLLHVAVQEMAGCWRCFCQTTYIFASY